jgi:hypothetical protein
MPAPNQSKTQFTKDQTVKYLNKDFQGFKRDLMKFSQAHHSGVFQDFNESSPGMAVLELQAFIGDILSLYQDMQFEEVKQESAQQIENVVSFAKSLGYRPQGKRAARGKETFFVEVPATTVNGQTIPDDSYSPILRRGAQVQGPNNSVFETLDDIAFSASSPDYPRMVTGSQFDSTTGLPTHFAIRKDIEIIAGQTIVETFPITDFQQFLQIKLSNPDVVEILSVFDSAGNEWTEVEYLAQEAVFDADLNSDTTDNTDVPYILKLVTVPRRFISDRDPTDSTTSLIFGSGDGQNFDDELIPNLADYALPLAGRRTFASFAIDPQNFLKTQTLGLSPYNTTLTVSYRVGGGPTTNVQNGSIKSVTNAQLDFSTTSLDTVKKSAVINSLECINVQKTDGGAPEETIAEIKANSAAFFAAQNRVVTKEDFIARILTLPAKFGKPDKVYVKRDSINPLAIDVHVLARDADNHLQLASANLKANIRSYLAPYRMITDGINILDAKIINLRVKFGVTVSPKVNRTEVLAKCLSTIQDYFNVDGQQIGHPIVISELAANLQAVQGVISVYELVFTNVIGNAPLPGSQITLPYSNTRFDVSHSRQDEIIYCPQDSIFEVKFPMVDIQGVAK